MDLMKEIKKNPVQAIIAIAGIVGLLLWLRSKKAQTSGISVSPDSSSTTDNSGYIPASGSNAVTPTVIVIRDEPHLTPASNLTPVSQTQETGSTFATSGVIRKNTNNAYDKTHSGIPLNTSSGNSHTVIAQIPFNTPVNITGPKVDNPYHTGQFTYPVSYNGKSGFVSSYDFASIGL